MRPAVAAVAAVALSATAIFFADSLHPVWWLMWLAPIPVLLLAPRLTALPLFGAAFLAWAVGHLNLVSYYRMVQIPYAVIALAVAGPALLFGLSALLYRVLVLRGHALAAAAAFASFWTLCQYLIEYSGGSYGDLAYTQMNCLPLLQLASVTGMSGITFVVMLIPASVAAAVTARSKRAVLAVTAAVLVAVFGFGVSRLGSHGDDPTVVVGMVVSDLKQNLLPEKPDDASRLLKQYAEEAVNLGRRGARIILLPEMAAVVTDDHLAELDQLFGQTARAANARILVPILHPMPEGRRNEARLYDATGRLEATYWKHHLVPVLEDRTRPGTELALLRDPRSTIGIEICRDMDFVPLARRYGREGTGLLLVPAWDFVVDDWLHSRMAFMRGVENGFHVARLAKQGRMTLLDAHGRVRVERDSKAAPFSTLLAPVGLQALPTLYTRWGDWFIGVLVLILCACLAYGFSRRSSP
ncbi:nitrilase-related carbon-nitrogen hydrolase [uncultured Paludibaculum sp.]|uniref:nitrilase-related carbon-nitrogen hydrolase n=1 Tax=uncultured Paludibaculum sp. TaxID=1765020 RepID=UPI002AAAE448|nr:nitrilase-related carbon-nitrogen hydrolase [uncultured Paludibaculum sp.]